MKGEVWVDAPRRGIWNMAMDQAMLEYAAATHQVLLRVYAWSRPTVSLGYFQSYESLAGFPALNSLDCVRRVTGGGAILHDREITYSIAVPGDRRSKGHHEALYRAAHRAVVDWLCSMSFDARLWEDVNQKISNTSREGDAFWCFDRRSDVDIVIEERKIFGSAQRRNEFGLLQHGSLLLAGSDWMPRWRGLGLQCPDARHLEADFGISLRKLVEVLTSAFDEVRSCTWSDGKADNFVCERAKAIAEEQFSTVAWTQFKRRMNATNVKFSKLS